MDSNHLGPAQGGESEVDAGDWRSQLQPDSRHQIVDRIMETLKRLLPVSGPEGLSEMRKIAVRFEEKIYTAATSESEYRRKITVKMLTMEPNSETTTALPPKSAPTINCRIRSTRFTSPPPNSGFRSALNNEPAQGGEPRVDAGDWRSQLQPDSRHQIVDRIMETLKRILPVSGPEGLSEMRKIAVRFEEKIYTAATSESTEGKYM
ncbi:mediator of RNA polymerase II transcription subunit 15a-like isoform X3 [Cucurbita pepo subsp. pepo]|uniref:mediator of RNA polymerase II transcription subunit 15a-like isoform X3 n=1 Tax=Cucurbita pepo subsp. pepo TaxID=3664 RepID=UPI000C9DA37F|nr:mediator of RNA polymerase II transcription subunit 15a-like isoform X3 [Cucurbita pepo subsp. pepo]